MGTAPSTTPVPVLVDLVAIVAALAVTLVWARLFRHPGGRTPAPRESFDRPDREPGSRRVYRQAHRS